MTVASTSRASVPTGSPSIRASCSSVAADVDPLTGSNAYLAAGDSSNLFVKPAVSHNSFNGALSLRPLAGNAQSRSEEHTSELQSLMRNSYAVFCLKKKILQHTHKK